MEDRQTLLIEGSKPIISFCDPHLPFPCGMNENNRSFLRRKRGVVKENDSREKNNEHEGDEKVSFVHDVTPEKKVITGNYPG